MSVMALQGHKSSPQKSRPLESGNRRHAVWIAIEYSYKLGQKNEFKFWCELGWFLQRQSHIVLILQIIILGHEVVRLPVAHCELNPIDMVWSQVKGHVKENNRKYAAI